MSTALVLLAAGKGTRMHSDLPKVLHPIGQAPMLAHALRAGQTVSPERTIIVAGHGSEDVKEVLTTYDDAADVVIQAEQLGTAHAVAQARPALDGFSGDVIVLYGDTPFIRPETLDAMRHARSDADIVVLGFHAKDPARYGRLIMEGDLLRRIVEFKDASDEERTITLCNSGLVCCDKDLLFDLIQSVGDENASGEFYLTDIVEIARGKGLTATAVTCVEAETLGINSRADLAQAEAVFQANARQQLLADGVTLMAPETVHLAFDTVIGRDSVIEPNVVFGPGVTVESGVQIRAFSHLEGCHVSRGAIIGPYARLRPGTELSEDTKIGNFVEIKNATIAEGAKVNHLSYVGDASIGANSNVGAGTITCNYDGVMKHHTEIGENVFIGSNTMLVAPVTIGDNAMTASGSVITKNVEPGALALTRGQQTNKPGAAVRLFDLLKAKKKQKDKGKS